MTDNVRLSFPFLWASLRPRAAIASAIATLSELRTALLAIAGGCAVVASWVMDEDAVGALADPRILAAGIAFGCIAGLLNVYVLGWIVAWLARKMGSVAVPAQVRTALALGQAPNIIGTIIVLALMIGIGEDLDAEPRLLIAMRLLLLACMLWAALITLRMLMRVLEIAWWRSIAVYVLGALLCPLLAASVIRTLLFHPFDLPASSMAPTLLLGDYVFVSKYSYGYSGASLPVAFTGSDIRIFAADPKPGDVIAFAARNGSTSYIKRVVATAGDRVQMRDGQLVINGAAVLREAISSAGDASCGTQQGAPKAWRETLSNGASYVTQDCVEGSLFDNTPEYTVPAGHVFVLGDNRDNSADSRAQRDIGYVPLPTIIGRVAMICFSQGSGESDGMAIRFERIGTMVK